MIASEVAPRQRIRPEELRRMDRATFVATFGHVFEYSPWVAEAAFPVGPFEDLDGLHAAMVAALQKSDRDAQLALIRAHPDLAGRAAIAGDLTAASRQEQAGSGLDRLTPEEYARFRELNDAYQRKFDFPFIMAVKSSAKDQILAAFEKRLNNRPEQEFERALAEIAKIARFRLADILGA